MGYVTNNLMFNEKVIYVGKVHWFIFVPSFVIFLLAVFLFYKYDSSIIVTMLSYIFFLLSVISLIKAVIFKISTELAVTSKRIIAKVGFISRSTIELNHSKVESFNVEQSILGRIFGFGTVVVCGTGGSKTPIPNIDAPLEFRKQAVSVVDEAGSPKVLEVV